MSTDKLQDLDRALAEIFRKPPLISTTIEPKPEAVADQPDEEEAADQAPNVDTPRDPDSALGRGEHAKALLAGLDIDTAIRLRWAMRDIRSKRTTLLPVSENDLAALIDLGLVELRDGIPRLTGLGVLALD